MKPISWISGGIGCSSAENLVVHSAAHLEDASESYWQQREWLVGCKRCYSRLCIYQKNSSWG